TISVVSTLELPSTMSVKGAICLLALAPIRKWISRRVLQIHFPAKSASGSHWTRLFLTPLTSPHHPRKRVYLAMPKTVANQPTQLARTQRQSQLQPTASADGGPGL